MSTYEVRPEGRLVQELPKGADADGATDGAHEPDATATAAVVVFGNVVDVLVPSSAADPAARREAVRALNATEARGSTDLCGGWLRGCEEAARRAGGEAVTRVLLLTDGLANRGEQDHDVIERHAAELNRRGVVTSTIGVGADYDERLLKRMAVAGGGNAYFLSDAVQIADTLTTEVGEAAEAVARNVRIVLSGEGIAGAFCPAWGLFTKAADGTWVLPIGQLASAEERRETVEILLVRRPAGDVANVIVRLVDDDGALAGEPVCLSWTFAWLEEVDAEEGDREVRLEACRARAAALKAEKISSAHYGDAAEAIESLHQEARVLRRRARGDRRILDIADDLVDAALRLEDEAFRANAGEIKMLYAQARYVTKGRGPDGQARYRNVGGGV